MNKMFLSVATALCLGVNAFAQESNEIFRYDVEYDCKNMDLPEDSANIAFPSMVINFPTSIGRLEFVRTRFDSLPGVQKNNTDAIYATSTLEYTSALDSSVYVKIKRRWSHYENNSVQLWRKCAPGTWLSENSPCDTRNFEHSFEEVLLYEVEQWVETGLLAISKDSALTLVNDKLVRMKEADKRGDLYGMVYNPNCKQYVAGGRLDIDTVLFTLYYGQNSYLDSLFKDAEPLAVQPSVSKMPFHQLQKTCSGYEIIFSDSKAHKVRLFSMTGKLLTEENAIGQYKVPVMNASVILQVDGKITKLLR